MVARLRRQPTLLPPGRPLLRTIRCDLPGGLTWPSFSLGGFYGVFEISLLFPDVHGSLVGPVTVGGVPSAVALDSANLNATGSPRIELGYRLGDGLGAVSISYRSMVSQGGETLAGFDALGAGYLSTRIDFNVIDIDYDSSPFNFAPCWELAWRAGIRTTAAYYDNLGIGGFVHEQATSNFVGAGPHATVEVGRALSMDRLPGLGVLTKLDGGLIIGNLSQSFEQTLEFPAGPVGDTTRFNHTEVVPMVTFDLGLTYSPPGAANWARFGFGYQFEYWWDVGSSGASHGNFSGNSLFFRAEFNF